MNEYFWVLLLVCGATLLIGLFVLLANKGFRKPVNLAFSLFCLSTAVWSGGVCAMFMCKSQECATLWTRLYTVPVAFIPVFYIHYIHYQTGYIGKQILAGLYVMAVLFVVFIAKGWMVAPAVSKYGFEYMVQAGPLDFLLDGSFFVIFVWSYVLLIRAYRSKTGLEKRKLLYIIVAFVVGSLGGMTNLWVPYNFWIYPINPYATLTVIFFVATIAYAIVRFHLLDIKIFIRRAALLASIYALLVLGTIPVMVFMHGKVMGSAPSHPLFLGLEALIVGAILSFGPFLYAYFVRESAYFRERTMAGLTHELKSPLAAIESAMEVLGEQVGGAASGPKQTEYIEMVGRNLSRLRQYVDDLIHVFKAGETKIHIEAQPVDLRDLCREVAAEYMARAQGKGVSLLLEGGDEKVIARCDPSKIRQAVSNLVSNAVKFTTTGSIQIRVREMEGQVNVVVEDTGRGIPADELPYIFDRFYQGSGGQQSKGTGIGLTIAKMWVEAHGSEIHAESDGPGQGSRFWFTLPK
ncbi:MAG: hypothetical protein LHV69_04360 [Elusimicrobia bacterium]|nr:hypothetical protein [Candidatus Obscuribacterium magneticum]